MELIEKTFLLRDVDLLRGLESRPLTLLASAAEVVDGDAGAVVARGDGSDPAFVVVVRGEVEVVGGDGSAWTVGAGGSFGARGLLVGDPGGVEVRMTKPGRLLRLPRSTFRDLVVENPEIAAGLLEVLARRYRTALT